MIGYWTTAGTHRRFLRPEVGAVVAWDFGVWRVIATTDVPEVDWTEREAQRAAMLSFCAPYYVILRPVSVAGDDPRARDHDVHLRVRGDAGWEVYDDPIHYPVCACCGGTVPCLWLKAQQAGEQALKRMGRYEMAGVCPACAEPVTRRQQSMTWPDNVELPGGPPVTFHLRRACWSTAQAYEKRWVAAAPEQRRHTLSCVGHVTTHGDGTYECTQMMECPGPQAGHRSYTTCRPINGTIWRDGPAGACIEPACEAAERYGCHPAPTARRRDA